MEFFQSRELLFEGAPAFLTLPFAVIAGGALIVLILLVWIIAAIAGRSRRLREEEQLEALYDIEDETPSARPITPMPAPQPVETYDEVLQVNLKAAMFLAQAAAKEQIRGGHGGAQVHLLSVRAQLGLRGRGYSAYCSTKGGLVMLIRQHASELATHGITVNGIAPTVVRTEMARHWLENPETRQQVLSRIPLGRVADPKDVAGAAVFFCSPAAGFVTGQVLYIDGGITASQ